jgi:hypothetical protein
MSSETNNQTKLIYWLGKKKKSKQWSKSAQNVKCLKKNLLMYYVCTAHASRSSVKMKFTETIITVMIVFSFKRLNKRKVKKRNASGRNLND